MDGLKCTVPGCKKVIYAMTGLQELTKLRNHMNRVHYKLESMEEALEIRAEMEKQNDRSRDR